MLQADGRLQCTMREKVVVLEIKVEQQVIELCIEQEEIKVKCSHDSQPNSTLALKGRWAMAVSSESGTARLDIFCIFNLAAQIHLL